MGGRGRGLGGTKADHDAWCCNNLSAPCLSPPQSLPLGIGELMAPPSSAKAVARCLISAAREPEKTKRVLDTGDIV